MNCHLVPHLPRLFTGSKEQLRHTHTHTHTHTQRERERLAKRHPIRKFIYRFAFIFADIYFSENLWKVLQNTSDNVLQLFLWLWNLYVNVLCQVITFKVWFILKYNLPIFNMFTSAKEVMFLVAFVRPSVLPSVRGFTQKSWTDIREIFWEGWKWAREEWLNLGENRCTGIEPRLIFYYFP